MAVTVLPLILNPNFLATGDLATFFVTTGSPTVSSGNGRNGTNSIRTVGASSTEATCAYSFTALSTLSFATAAKISRVPSVGSMIILEFLDGSTLHVDLRMTTAGQLQATRNGTVLATSSATVTTGVHHHIEMKATIADSGGIVKVWLNQTLVIDFTGDTRNGGNASATVVRFGADTVGSEPSTTIDWSDLHIANDQVGDKRVLWIPPDAAGTHGDFSNNGGSNALDSVDDSTQDGDTSYIASSTVGHKHSFGLTDQSTGPAVFAVASIVVAKKTDAGTRAFKPLLRISTTDYLGAEVSPGTSYGYSFNSWLVSPATSSAWTMNEVEQLGVEVTQ